MAASSRNVRTEKDRDGLLRALLQNYFDFERLYFNY